jgi:hypothetical protein
MHGRIFGPRKIAVLRGWRQFYNKKLPNLYSSPNIILIVKAKRIRRVRNVVFITDKINACKIIGRELETKRPLGILES